MTLWRVVSCLAIAACYRGTSSLAPCTVQGLPGESCAIDAATTCGEVGGACCETGPACGDNAYCTSGTCTSGCVTEITFGRRHSCVLRHDGTVWCAGDNGNGQLADRNGGMSATYVQIPDITDATEIAAGWAQTCAVRAGGTVWCWGSNGNGELGANGGPELVQVGNASGGMLANVVELTGGSGFTCARGSDGSISCWGRDAEGQLGDNLFTQRTAGIVPGIPPAKAMVTGRDHVCILGTDGTMWCWGEDNSGQLGDGNSGNGVVRGAPFQVPLAMTATHIAAGSFHTCALLADTSVQCWGGNWQQAIGVGGDGRNITQPAAVLTSPAGASYSGAASIAAGGGVSFAVTTDGHVDTWGDSVHGQAGNGAGGVYPTRVPLEGISRVVSHYAHACALGSDGTIECWGRNSEGELGDGTFTNVALPQAIVSVCP